MQSLLEAWIRELPNFDVAASTPAGPDGSWYRELSEVSGRIHDELVRITARYERGLPPGLIVTLDRLMDSRIISLMRLLGGVSTLYQDPASTPPSHWEPFRLPGVDDAPEQFAELFLSAVDQCEQLMGKRLTVDSTLWEDVIPPLWSRSRYPRPQPHSDS